EAAYDGEWRLCHSVPRAPCTGGNPHDPADLTVFSLRPMAPMGIPGHLCSPCLFGRGARKRPGPAIFRGSGPMTRLFEPDPSTGSGTEPRQKSQSSSSVASALPMTYDEPDPEKKSWFSSAFGESAERIAGFTFAMSEGNIAS